MEVLPLFRLLAFCALIIALARPLLLFKKEEVKGRD